MLTLSELTARWAGPGRVDWIGLRPAKRAPVQSPAEAQVTLAGLDGDRARAGKRTVTLIQAEHLQVIAALSGHAAIAPEVLRRNIVVSGINLNTLKGRDVRVGGAVLRWTTICAPCSRMEAALGHGGYNAMRGHGGWCAEVVQTGVIRIGDPVDIAGELTA
ncbi:MAG: MOSC domain-containing protein [Pseudomonadota bacterium]